MISTHKMLAAAGVENKAQIIDQASTLSPNTLTFFDCSETAALDPGNIADGGSDGAGTAITRLTDVVGGLQLKTWDSSVQYGHQMSDGVAANTVRMLSWKSIAEDPDTTLIGGNWPSPGTDDYLIFAFGNTVHDGSDVDSVGTINFYMGDITTADGGAFKVQPYYSSYVNLARVDLNTMPVSWLARATEWKEKWRARETGVNLGFVAAKRGDNLEQYSNDGFEGSENITDQCGGIHAAAWRSPVMDNYFACGHGAWGCETFYTEAGVGANKGEYVGERVIGAFTPCGGNTAAAGEVAQDFYGFLYHKFPNGLPSQAEIENGLRWMKTQWALGNKVIYPGWMF